MFLNNNNNKRLSIFNFVSFVLREEELQLQKRKKRKIKGNSRLSFADDFENGSEDEDGENGNALFLFFLNYGRPK